MTLLHMAQSEPQPQDIPQATGSVEPGEATAAAPSQAVSESPVSAGGWLADTTADPIGSLRLAAADVIVGPSGRPFVASLALVTALHMMVIGLLVRTAPPDEGWTGGIRLEAIDVDIVSTPGVDTTRLGDSTAETTGAPETAPSSPSPASSTAPVEAKPDLTPPEAERPQLVVAENTGPVTPPTPPPPEEAPDPPRTELQPRPAFDLEPTESAPAAASTLATVAGIAIAGGRLDTEPNSVAAVATPGETTAYRQSVMEALSRSKPRLQTRRTGTVRIVFSIGAGGEVVAARVARTSGRAELDEAALQAVRSARFQPPPRGIANADLAYEIPYYFR